MCSLISVLCSLISVLCSLISVLCSLISVSLQDEQNERLLCDRLATLEQQLKMERRMRRKTQKFYKGRVEATKSLVHVNKHDKTAKGSTIVYTWPSVVLFLLAFITAEKNTLP